MHAYWKLLLRNRLTLFLPSRQGGEKRWKSLLSWCAKALLLLAVYAGALFLEMKVFDYGVQLGEPQVVITLALLGSTFITLIYGFFYLISLLFFSKDISFAAALPITSHGVLAAKLGTVLLGEMGITTLVCAPLLIRYGVETAANAGYYVRALVGMLCGPMIPVAVGTLLAFVLIRISALWKRREGVTTVMTFAFIALVYVLQINLKTIDDDQIGGMAIAMLFGAGGMTNMLLGFYPPLRWLSEGMRGVGAAAWGNTALFVAISLAAIALVWWLCGGSYLRLSLKQAEIIQRINNAKRGKKRVERQRSPFWALYRQEMREVIAVPTYATNCLTGIVVFPMLIVILYFSMQKTLEGVGPLLQMAAQMVPKDIYLAGATAFLALTATMGLAVPTAVSREGKRHDLRCTYPVPGAVQLGAKLAMGMTFNAIEALVTAILLWAFLPFFWVETLIALGISQVFSLLWCLIGLLIDVYHPKLQWKTEAEAVKQSMNAMLAMFGGMLVLFGMCALYVLVLRKLDMTLSAAIGLFTLLMALLAAGGCWWLATKGAETYCLREYSK